jgi:hypothetical protein
VGLPVTHWSAPLLGEHVRSQGIAISDRSVSRILEGADLQPDRQQMYLTSHDDEFREKRDDVLRVYYETPKHEHIVCVDEKTGIQALERRCADIATKRGQPARRESEYIRHGTLCWMGALDVRRGKPFGFAHAHDSDTFIELLDFIEAVYRPGRGHIIMRRRARSLRCPRNRGARRRRRGSRCAALPSPRAAPIRAPYRSSPVRFRSTSVRVQEQEQEHEHEHEHGHEPQPRPYPTELLPGGTS